MVITDNTSRLLPSQQTGVNNIKDGTETAANRSVDSDIQRFYAKKTVFITGSTGFMGKCLIEKLLRSCPDVERIYVLVREKKGATAEERIKKYFEDVVFDTLRSMGNDFSSKIHLIVGDLIKDDMALSENDRNVLINEIDLIFHNASNVKFTERLSTALKINVIGTKAIIDLAKQCKHIEGLMYMSTAYSHCYQKYIMEEAYPSPADMKTVQDLITTDLTTSTGLKGDNLKNILGKFPNTYTFTKAIAEGLISDTSKVVSFPCIIYRPSIVINSWKEPARGWCENMNGPGLLFSSFGLGIIHTALSCNCKLDMIPVDLSINAQLVAMWDGVKERLSESGVHVYNYGSSVEKPISVARLRKHWRSAGSTENPSIHALWKTFVIFTDCPYYFFLLHFLFHIIPAAIADVYLYMKGKKTRALATLGKIRTNYEMLLYFLRGEWKIDISRVKNAIDRMNPIDNELFFCDVRKLDWEDFGKSHWNGLRLYVLKEPTSTLPAARRRMRIIETVHYTIQYAVILLIGYAILRIFGLL